MPNCNIPATIRGKHASITANATTRRRSPTTASTRTLAGYHTRITDGPAKIAMRPSDRPGVARPPQERIEYDTLYRATAYKNQHPQTRSERSLHQSRQLRAQAVRRTIRNAPAGCSTSPPDSGPCLPVAPVDRISRPQPIDPQNFESQGPGGWKASNIETVLVETVRIQQSAGRSTDAGSIAAASSASIPDTGVASGLRIRIASESESACEPLIDRCRESEIARIRDHPHVRTSAEQRSTVPSSGCIVDDDNRRGGDALQACVNALSNDIGRVVRDDDNTRHTIRAAAEALAQSIGANTDRRRFLSVLRESSARSASRIGMSRGFPGMRLDRKRRNPSILPAIQAVAAP